MPMMAELKTLYKKGTGSRNMTPLLKTTAWSVWSSETSGSLLARYFSFHNGTRFWRFRKEACAQRFAVR